MSFQLENVGLIVGTSPKAAPWTNALALVLFRMRSSSKGKGFCF